MHILPCNFSYHHSSSLMLKKFSFVFAQCRKYNGCKIVDNNLQSTHFNLYGSSRNLSRLAIPYNPQMSSHGLLLLLNMPFSNNDKLKVNFVINHAWLKSTLDQYNAYMKKFFNLCHSQGIYLSTNFYTSEHLLCFFVASIVGFKARGTASGKISVLKTWHIQNDLPWMGSSWLKYMLKDMENLQSLDSIQENRPPVSLEMIHLFGKQLDLSLPEDACIWAIVCTALYSKIEKDFDVEITPTWKQFRIFFPTETKTLHLPKTKQRWS